MLVMPSSSSLAAASGADPDLAPRHVCFSVHARAEPGVMPRVIELFAKRGLVPHSWHSTAAGAALTIDVQIAGLGRDLADYMARCMRQIAGVETVLTVETGPAG
jgi:acetolactate synthase small subunit